jgi:hypothetical protein
LDNSLRLATWSLSVIQFHFFVFGRFASGASQCMGADVEFGSIKDATPGRIDAEPMQHCGPGCARGGGRLRILVLNNA